MADLQHLVQNSDSPACFISLFEFKFPKQCWFTWSHISWGTEAKESILAFWSDSKNTFYLGFQKTLHHILSFSILPHLYFLVELTGDIRSCCSENFAGKNSSFLLKGAERKTALSNSKGERILLKVLLSKTLRAIKGNSIMTGLGHILCRDKNTVRVFLIKWQQRERSVFKKLT